MGLSKPTGDTTKGAINAIASTIQTATVTTTSATFVDITNPSSITLVTTKQATIVAAFNGTFSTNVIDSVAFCINIDGTDYMGNYVYVPVANGNSLIQCQVLVTGVAAGSHTIKARWLIASGVNTASLYFSAAAPIARLLAWAVVE